MEINSLLLITAYVTGVPMPSIVEVLPFDSLESCKAAIPTMIENWEWVLKNVEGIFPAGTTFTGECIN